MTEKIISIKSTIHTQFLDITSDVERFISKNGIRTGAVVIFTRHTTTAVVINENETGILEDYVSLLERLVPRKGDYRHDMDEGNAHSHLRSILLGPSKIVPIIDGRLALGTWQRIFFVELDGPRSRNCILQSL